VNVTFERRNKSVDIPLLADASGQPLLARDIGKPNLRLQTNGRINPRSADFWSCLENYNIRGQFTSGTAYEDAIKLADMVKAGASSAGTLSIPADAYPSSVSVQPAAEQERALVLTYPPGRRKWVEVELGLTRVGDSVGVGQTASTPTSTSSGSITLSDGTNTVNLDIDIQVERTIGRPNSVVRRSTGQFPRYIEKRKSAYDSFELTFEKHDNAAKVTQLISMFNEQQERGSLTLDFNGTYRMGAFDVIPSGSTALRQVEPAAQEGIDVLPSIDLRVVNNS
jgi:hypothetical protein